MSGGFGGCIHARPRSGSGWEKSCHTERFLQR
jgi:hypothetical protein